MAPINSQLTSLAGRPAAGRSLIGLVTESFISPHREQSPAETMPVCGGSHQRVGPRWHSNNQPRRLHDQLDRRVFFRLPLSLGWWMARVLAALVWSAAAWPSPRGYA